MVRVSDLVVDLDPTAGQEMKFPFHRGGFSHQLLAQEGQVCLVERTRGKRTHWEVVILHWTKAGVIEGRHIEATWSYPSSESWGQSGWTYNDLAKAEEKFESLKALKGPL